MVFPELRGAGEDARGDCAGVEPGVEVWGP
jgi:hypothetical protein